MVPVLILDLRYRYLPTHPHNHSERHYQSCRKRSRISPRIEKTDTVGESYFFHAEWSRSPCSDSRFTRFLLSQGVLRVIHCQNINFSDRRHQHVMKMGDVFRIPVAFGMPYQGFRAHMAWPILSSTQWHQALPNVHSLTKSNEHISSRD